MARHNKYKNENPFVGYTIGLVVALIIFGILMAFDYLRNLLHR
jgi:tetrahydromethanopterin S-methyltransferase subunit F